MNQWFIIEKSSLGKNAVAAVDIPKETQIVQYKGKLTSNKLAEKISQKHRDLVNMM
jgi:serine acetyltransferase